MLADPNTFQCQGGLFMQKTAKRLGRGLSSLISVDEDLPVPPNGTQQSPAEPSAASFVDVGQIRPNPFQPRKEIAPEQIQSLAESIKNNGLLQPIVVRQKKAGLYELIAGERRWRACQMAGLSQIPAVIREASDEQMLELALIENIFREDLNAIDRALTTMRGVLTRS
jgi:ParB family chromosome partitioning protein